MFVSVGFYPARDYKPLVEFGGIRRWGSKRLVLADEEVDTLVGCLPAKRDSICVGGESVTIKYEIGNYRIHTKRRRGSARLFICTEYISPTQLDMDYLVRVFNVVQQQLRDYLIALPEVLSYVTSFLTSLSYIEPMPNASKNID